MKFIREIGKAFFVGSLIFLIIGIIQYLNGAVITDGKQLLRLFAYNQLYSVALYMANAVLVSKLLKRFQGDIFKLEHLSKAVFGSVAVTLFTIFLLRIVTQVGLNGESMARSVLLECFYHFSGGDGYFLYGLLLSIYPRAEGKRAEDHSRHSFRPIRRVEKSVRPSFSL
jgi:hypothetical protein